MSASTSKWTAGGIKLVTDRTDDAGGWEGTSTSGTGPAPGPSNIVRKIRYIDCTSVSMASAIQYKVMHIPANTLVTNVLLLGTAKDNITWGVGDATSATTFLTTVNTSDAGGQNASTEAAVYTSADEICLTPSNTAATFKGYIVADFSRAATTGQN